MHETIENPPLVGGLSGKIDLGGSEFFQNSPKTSQNQPVSLRQARAAYLNTMAPGADPATLETRTRLLVARDTFMTRIGAWREWPEQLQSIHVFAANEASHAAFSDLPGDDLAKYLEAMRFMARATLILRDLGGERHAH